MESRESILTFEEVTKLPSVIDRRKRFQRILKTSIANYQKLFSNCIMISGKPGSGKTTLVMSYLDKLKDEGLIDTYIRAAGHLTPRSLYNLLYEASETNKENGLPRIIVLDDVDCLKDQGCLELMKAAFDTKSNLPSNRQVYYLTEGRKASFKFNGFGIIITNDDFMNKENSVHMNALLDRVQPVSCDLKIEDMQIYTTSLVDDYLTRNEDHLTENELTSITNFFNTDVRKWMATNSFQKANVPYSLRLIKKFIDAQRSYEDDWKQFSLPYQKLEAAYDVITSPDKEGYEEEHTKVNKGIKVIKKRGRKPSKKIDIPSKNADGKFIGKRGEPLCETLQKRFSQLEKRLLA